MIGVFLLLAAQMEERSAVFHSVLETVHLGDIMLTDFATLSPAEHFGRCPGKGGALPAG